jgi:hypothetical protein
VRGLFVPEEFEEHSGKPEDRIRRKTLGVRQVPHGMKGSMDVGAPVHQVKDFFFLGHDSLNLLVHEREKKSRQVLSGNKVMAGWIRESLGKIPLK